MIRSRTLIARPLAGLGAVAMASAGVVVPLSASAEASVPHPAGPQPAGPRPAGPRPAGPIAAQRGPYVASAPAAPVATVRPATVPVRRRLVVLGDSVAQRRHCGCESFVSNYAKLVSDRATVHVDNLAGDGQTTDSVRQVLAQEATQELIRQADTVVFVAGANDYRHAFDQVGHGRRPVTAYRAVGRRVQRNLVSSIRTVHQLNPRARVLSFGYWNAFKDGAVARTSYTPTQLHAAAAATTSANNAIHAAAKATASRYLSAWHAFAAAGDITPLLAADGDHPSPAGNAVLARTLADAIWVK